MKKPRRRYHRPRGRSQRRRASPPSPRGTTAATGPPREDLPIHRFISPPLGWESPTPPPQEQDPKVRQRQHRMGFARRFTPTAAMGWGGWLGLLFGLPAGSDVMGRTVSKSPFVASPPRLVHRVKPLNPVTLVWYDHASNHLQVISELMQWWCLLFLKKKINTE
jgi:hypothetical protein